MPGLLEAVQASQTSSRFVNAVLVRTVPGMEEEVAGQIVRWKHRAERAEALVEVQKKVAALLGTPLDTERS